MLPGYAIDLLFAELLKDLTVVQKLVLGNFSTAVLSPLIASVNFLHVAETPLAAFEMILFLFLNLSELSLQFLFTLPRLRKLPLRALFPFLKLSDLPLQILFTLPRLRKLPLSALFPFLKLSELSL